MQIKSLSPYITFDGTATDAIALYERVLGADRISVTRAGDVPATTVSEDQTNRIVHGVLRLGAAQLLVSDATSSSPSGSNIHVALDFADLDEMTRCFNALSEKGTITVPLQDTFWGARFGMLTDRFGVRWMFNWSSGTTK
jgi:PhnB protein